MYTPVPTNRKHPGILNDSKSFIYGNKTLPSVNFIAPDTQMNPALSQFAREPPIARRQQAGTPDTSPQVNLFGFKKSVLIKHINLSIMTMIHKMKLILIHPHLRYRMVRQEEKNINQPMLMFMIQKCIMIYQYQLKLKIYLNLSTSKIHQIISFFSKLIILDINHKIFNLKQN